MTKKLVIGLDGEGSGKRALDYGLELAEAIGNCELLLVYVIEWSPYTFQTAEENAQRHKRREEEISQARERIVDPAIASVKGSNIKVNGMVRHGDVADTLNSVCKSEGGDHIIVGRSSEGGFAQRIFGSATGKLVMSADVPVTVVK